MKARAWLSVLAVAALPAGVAAQDLGARITAGGDGVARMSFAVREGVEICEDGVRLFGDRMRWEGRRFRSDRCAAGPASVELTVRNGRVSGVELLKLDEEGTPGARDLGQVSPEGAVAALLQVARGGRGDADDAVFPVILADVADAWQDLLSLAQDRDVRRDVRKAALFWVGQEAAEAATAGLAEVARDEAEDQEVRDAAVFALSQRDPSESVPVLMEVARTAEHGKTRRSAFFWLAQMDDPRVAEFFREVLRGGG